jgi:hypothetical protein
LLLLCPALFITLPVTPFVLLLPIEDLHLSLFKARLPNPEPSGASLNLVEQLLLADLTPCCWQLPKIAASVLLLLLLLPVLMAYFDWRKDSVSKAGRV